MAHYLDQSNQSHQSIACLYWAVPFANLCILSKNASPKLISCSKLASHLIFFIQNLMYSVLLELRWVVKNLISATIALIKWLQCISHRFPDRLWTILLFTLSSIEREREINWVTGIYPTNNSTLRPTETTQVQICDWIMMWEGLCTLCSWIAPRWGMKHKTYLHANLDYPLWHELPNRVIYSRTPGTNGDAIGS